jgi:hypothetical protein
VKKQNDNKAKTAIATAKHNGIKQAINGTAIIVTTIVNNIEIK